MASTPTVLPHEVWDRVVCGLDLTAASRHAALVAARLMPESATLTLCTVVGPEATDGGALASQTVTREARNALDDVQREVDPFHSAELHLREGPVVARLLEELQAERATLVAVGSRHSSREAGTALGGVASAMLHRSPCSVLIAQGDDARRAGEVIVGFDDSGGARRALATGRQLAGRLAVKLRVIVATGDMNQPPGPGWREELGDVAVTEVPSAPVEALVAASASAQLLIVGSRHLTGVPALSSVSERVGSRASCPVLVMR